MKGIPQAKEFFIRCTKCGVYRISENTARRFLANKLQEKLDKSIKKGAHGAILTFLRGCPNCELDNPDAIIEVAALKPRIH